MNESNRIGILLFLHSRKELSSSEERELLIWRRSSPDNERLYREMSDPEFIRKMMIDFYQDRDAVFAGLNTRFPYMENTKAYDGEDFAADPELARMDEEKKMSFPEKDIADSGLSRAEFWNTLLEEARFGTDITGAGSDGAGKAGMPVKKKRKRIVRVLRVIGAIAAVYLTFLALSLLKYVIFGESSGSGRFQSSLQETDNLKEFAQDFKRGFKAARAHLEPGENAKGEPMDIFEGNPKAGTGKIYTMVTYNGNEEILQLPDSTILWMYPNTMFFFPAHFNSDTIRLKMVGKIYFETTSQKHFIIAVSAPALSSQQNAGTKDILIEPSAATTFDVRAYPNDTAVGINIVHGSARVSEPGSPGDHSLQVESGQQLIVSRGLPALKPASDTAEIFSLKNGQIDLKDVGIKEIMAIVAQWYDIRIQYLGEIPDKKYSLKVPLESKLTLITDMLNKQGLHITKQGRIITVIK